MVQSRSLCDFEKNVLLTLIGSVIQPNKVHIVCRYDSLTKAGLSRGSKSEFSRLQGGANLIPEYTYMYMHVTSQLRT